MRSMVEGCRALDGGDTPPSGLTACHLPLQGRNRSYAGSFAPSCALYPSRAWPCTGPATSATK